MFWESPCYGSLSPCSGKMPSLLSRSMSVFQNCCYEEDYQLSTGEWNPAVFTERVVEGQREGGGRTLEHWICRTRGDVKLEVRNNWCNAGEWRRGLAEGGEEGRVRPLQCFAVGEHQSRAHLAAISAIRLQWDPNSENRKDTSRPCTTVHTDCAVQHYSLLFLTPCVHCSKYNYLSVP